jgi:hypothetical protein
VKDVHALGLAATIAVVLMALAVWRWDARRTGGVAEPQSSPAISSQDSLLSNQMPNLREQLEEGSVGPLGEAEPAHPPGSPYIVIAESHDGVRRKAAVSIQNDRGETSLGETTAGGGLEVEAAAIVTPARMTAVSIDGEHLVGQVVLLEPPLVRTIGIDLSPSCELQGRVVDHQGQAQAGLRVVALDPLLRAKWLADRSAGLASARDGRWAEGVTGPNGDFALRGLLPGIHYAISAGGNGFAMNEAAIHQLRTCGEELRLEVHPLFGGAVRVGDAETNWLIEQCAQHMRGAVSFSMGRGDGFPKELGFDPAFVGTELEIQARYAEAEGRAVVLTAPVSASSIPAGIQFCVPFLPNVWHELSLPRVVDGLPLIQVPVSDAERGLGSLRLHGILPPNSIETLAPDSLVGVLRLRGRSSVEIAVRVQDLSLGVLIPGFPVGSYEWTFSYEGGERILPLTGVPAGTVFVEGDGGVLELNLAGSATAHLLVRDPDGVPHQGPLQAKLGTTGSVFAGPSGEMAVVVTDVATMSWSRPPYVVPFLPPGSYQVSCSTNGGRGWSVPYGQASHFLGDVVTTVELKGVR